MTNNEQPTASRPRECENEYFSQQFLGYFYFWLFHSAWLTGQKRQTNIQPLLDEYKTPTNSHNNIIRNCVEVVNSKRSFFSIESPNLVLANLATLVGGDTNLQSTTELHRFLFRWFDPRLLIMMDQRKLLWEGMKNHSLTHDAGCEGSSWNAWWSELQIEEVVPVNSTASLWTTVALE